MSELAKAVKRFNAKRSRLIKRDQAAEKYLPNKQSVKELRALIGNKKDERVILHDLNKFMEKGAESPIVTKQGVTTTRWQVDRLTRQTRRINSFRKRERERLEKERQAKGYAATSIERFENAPRKPSRYQTIRPGTWDEFIALSQIESLSTYVDWRDKQYTDNYLSALKGELGDTSLVDEIADVLSALSPEEIGKALKDDPLLEIDFLYSPEEREMKIYYLIDRWVNYAKKIGYEYDTKKKKYKRKKES